MKNYLPVLQRSVGRFSHTKLDDLQVASTQNTLGFRVPLSLPAPPAVGSRSRPIDPKPIRLRRGQVSLAVLGSALLWASPATAAESAAPAARHLFDAIRSNDTAAVRAYLDRGGEVSARNEIGDSPLHVATITAGPEVVFLLLETGVDVNGINRAGSPPLLRAASRPHLAEILLARRAPVNQSTYIGTALTQAAWADRPAMVRIMIEAGADLEARDPVGNFSALHWAASSERAKPGLASLLLAHGADPRAAGGEPIDAFLGELQTPLSLAQRRGSLALYAKLGFEIRETVSAFQGTPLEIRLSGYPVRPAREDDEAPCNDLCRRIHGHDRAGELGDAIRDASAMVVERGGRLTGYATGIGWFYHAVAETNDDLNALIGAASSFSGPGFLVPSRNGFLMRWCLEHQLRIVAQTTLMTTGLYNEPAGSYLPSILY